MLLLLLLGVGDWDGIGDVGCLDIDRLVAFI
jgi:hypothetical protein